MFAQKFIKRRFAPANYAMRQGRQIRGGQGGLAPPMLAEGHFLPPQYFEVGGQNFGGEAFKFFSIKAQKMGLLGTVGAKIFDRSPILRPKNLLSRSFDEFLDHPLSIPQPANFSHPKIDPAQNSQVCRWVWTGLRNTKSR